MKTLAHILEGILNNVDSDIDNGVKNKAFDKLLQKLNDATHGVRMAMLKPGKPFDYIHVLKDLQTNHTEIPAEEAVALIQSHEPVIAVGYCIKGKEAFYVVLVYDSKHEYQFKIDSKNNQWELLFGRDGAGRIYIDNYIKYKWLRCFKA